MPSSRLTPTTGGDSASAVVQSLVEKRAGRDWCLFLDRDGVINRRVVDDYVRHWGQFDWLPGAIEALRLLTQWAPHVVIVTNQQGVGKGLMTERDVSTIHRRMLEEAALGEGGIDAFKVCPHLASAGCGCRKPRPGLVLDWLGENPHCDPGLSIVVGDSPSDMELARNVGAVTGGCFAVQVTAGDEVANADLAAVSLLDFAVAVQGEELR